MVGRDAFLVLDLCLHVFNGVARLNFKRDGLSGQGLDENLHSTSQAKNKVKSGLLLNIVVAKSTTIFQLLASEDQPLLVGRDAFLVLDLCLHVFNGVARLNFKSDGLSGQGLDENLHATSQAKNKVKRRLFLNVVVTQSSAIFKLFASENETLLIGRDAFFVLDFRLHILDTVAWFNFKSDSLTGQSLHKDLHDEFRV